MKPEGEKQTRRDLIDKQLENAGWDPADHTKVIQEVDTKKWIPRNPISKPETIGQETRRYEKRESAPTQITRERSNRR